MNLSTPPRSEINWTVTISVHEREGQTQATARLLFGDHESVGGLSGSVPPNTASPVSAANWPPRGTVGSRATADSDRNQRPVRPG
jgi:hypothetical protein